MTGIQELYGFVIASNRRHNVLKALSKKPLRPAEISRATHYQVANVSITLFQLEKQGLVTCITPEKAVWRVYAITALGKQVLKYKG